MISFIGFTSQLFVVLPSYRNDRDRDASMWKVLVPFNLLLFLLFTSYVRTVNTNPGNVPRNWVSLVLSRSSRTTANLTCILVQEPDWQALEAQRDEAASENKPPVSRNARFCKPCQGTFEGFQFRARTVVDADTALSASRTAAAYKPPRTHHCRQCKTCILKMDHHCKFFVSSLELLRTLTPKCDPDGFSSWQ